MRIEHRAKPRSWRAYIRIGSGGVSDRMPSHPNGYSRLELGTARRWDRCSADAVEAVAPGDEVAVDALVDTVGAVRHERRIGGDGVQLDVGRFEHDVGAGGVGRRVEVGLDLGLAVRHHLLADPLHRVDREQVVAAPGEVDRLVDVALGVHSIAEADVAERLDRAPLEHAGADAFEDVLAAAEFEDDVVDAGTPEHVRQQRACRPCPDDDHLRPHGSPSIRRRSVRQYATLSTILYSFVTVIIDCHGHYTTTPPGVGAWRDAQVAAVGRRSGVRR